MSPGVTFERVYHELKRRLADGTLGPGMPIEPAALSAELAASITPIRDALHRLVGEALVEAPNHNGFRAPRLSEARLRDLYQWNGRAVWLAIRHLRREALDRVELEPSRAGIGSAAADLFRQVAQASGSDEHALAIDRLNDRLAPYRRIEDDVLDGLAEELGTLSTLLQSPERAPLNRAVQRYHRRRVIAAPRILAAHAGETGSPFPGTRAG